MGHSFNWQRHYYLYISLTNLPTGSQAGAVDRERAACCIIVAIAQKSIAHVENLFTIRLTFLSPFMNGTPLPLADLRFLREMFFRNEAGNPVTSGAPSETLDRND